MAGNTPNFLAHAGLGDLMSRYVDMDKVPWVDSRPGVRNKVLYMNKEEKQAVILSEVSPGAEIVDHFHTGLEMTYVLEGRLEDDEGVCEAGNFVWRPAGSRHQARAPEGALFLAFFQGSSKTVETGHLFPDFEN
ncbi:MAG: cupin domain-containing protein [Rhodospirillales bacterium]|nr:cupin domain-containing protein [Rhodospirillales bacterium]